MQVDVSAHEVRFASLIRLIVNDTSHAASITTHGEKWKSRFFEPPIFVACLRRRTPPHNRICFASETKTLPCTFSCRVIDVVLRRAGELRVYALGLICMLHEEMNVLWCEMV
jgi:hypothetical protein